MMGPPGQDWTEPKDNPFFLQDLSFPFFNLQILSSPPSHLVLLSLAVLSDCFCSFLGAWLDPMSALLLP
jgi:hypothetical protein